MSNTLSNQEAFNIMVRHLRRQGSPCEVGFDCAYRGGNERMCAVGAIIPNRMYDESFEGHNIGALLDLHYSRDTDIIETPELLELRYFLRHINVEMLTEMQYVHDNMAPEKWEYQWPLIANKHVLQIPE